MALSEFYYNGGDDLEDMRMYKPGGYHPVLLGDILPKDSPSMEPRYRIMQKLGRGAFATIWLARDIVGSLGYVALKIDISRGQESSNEVGILRWLRDLEPNHSKRGGQHIIRLLDDFTIEGPNGKHECMVTEVLAAMSDFMYTKAFPTYRRKVSRQLLQGLSYLHERGVTHGDLHSHNLGMALPQLQDFSENDIMSHFSNPECVAVVPRDPQKQTISLPPYLVESVSIVDFLEAKHALCSNEALDLKIMDFGNAFRKGDERPPPNTPISIRAPEVTFCELSNGLVEADWDGRVDVWAAACTLYELNFGNVMLYGMGRGERIIYRTCQLAGPPLPAWAPYWDMEEYCADKDASTNIDPDATWAERTDMLLRKKHGDEHVHSKQNTEQLVDLIREMLKMDPRERPRVTDLLDHPWFAVPSPAAA